MKRLWLCYRYMTLYKCLFIIIIFYVVWSAARWHNHAPRLDMRWTLTWQTLGVNDMLFKCWFSVVYVGPTLNQYRYVDNWYKFYVSKGGVLHRLYANDGSGVHLNKDGKALVMNNIMKIVESDTSTKKRKPACQTHHSLQKKMLKELDWIKTRLLWFMTPK